VCRHHAVAESTRRSAVDLLAEFEGISDVAFTAGELDMIAFDRRTARFGPLITLAKLLLVGSVPDRPGQGATYGLVFDMNVVFERYIGIQLRRVLSSPARTVRLQVSGRCLLRRGQQRRFRLKPDVAVHEGGDLVCLLDTKWKQLNSHRPHDGVSQSDMYQMYAYGKEYDCTVVILLYPQTDKYSRHVATYQHNPGEPGSPRIEVCTVDVRRLTAAGAGVPVQTQLRELVDMLALKDRYRT